jgi:hypothetical protein
MLLHAWPASWGASPLVGLLLRDPQEAGPRGIHFTCSGINIGAEPNLLPPSLALVPSLDYHVSFWVPPLGKLWRNWRGAREEPGKKQKAALVIIWEKLCGRSNEG